MKQYSKHLFVCEMGGNCSSRGSEGMGDLLKEVITSRGLESQVRVTKTACIGACGFGPNLVIYPDGIWYYGVQQTDLSRIVDETVIGGRAVDDLLFHRYGDPSVVEVVKDPVCGMIFRVSEAMCSETTLDSTLYFCSEECRRTYQADPSAYAPKKHGHRGALTGHASHRHHLG